tara:strand:+ start:1312 stop:1473 length:162 start_codon:yes stop_codon:yes gene_type:complete
MSESKLTEEQHKLVNYILAQGVIGERERLSTWLKTQDLDEATKELFLNAINGV